MGSANDPKENTKKKQLKFDEIMQGVGNKDWKIKKSATIMVEDDKPSDNYHT